MTAVRAIIALMRLDKPVGIFLLWFPTAWALCLGYNGSPPWTILFWFALGTIVMRSAGCVINDIADRKWDGFVKRTQFRPLVTQCLSLQTAWVVFMILIIMALLILIQLPQNCFYGAIPAAALTVLYPFCKRFISTPQLILGLAFASSIPMVALASQSHWSAPWTILLFITILWVVAYDTQYALADVEDDKKAGILSTAGLLKDKVHLFIYGTQITMHILWIYYAYLTQQKQSFYIGWMMAFLFGFYQFLCIQKQNPLQAFKNNTWYGLWMWLLLFTNKLGC